MALIDCSFRPMLYSMSTYGTAGVERALQILKVSPKACSDYDPRLILPP